MLTRIIIISIALALLATDRCLWAADKGTPEKILIAKSIPGNRQVAVVVGAPMEISDVMNLFTPEDLARRTLVDATGTLAPHECAFWVQLQLRVPGKAPVALWLELRLGPPGPDRRGCDALDLLVEPGRVVFAMALGPGIVLWRVDLVKGTAERCSLAGQWAQAAALDPLDRNDVAVKLIREPDGSIKAVVQDLRAPARLRRKTVFIQHKKDIWRLTVNNKTP